MSAIDPATAAVLDAARERLYSAVRAAMDEAAGELRDEGHCPAIIGTAMISSTASLLFGALLSQVTDEHREAVAQDAVDGLMTHLRLYAAGVPAGVTVQ